VLDIALVNLKKSDDFREVIPSKIFELASMEKPVLLGVEGEAKHLIEKYDAGLCFEPENDKDFLEKLEKLSSDETFYKKASRNCRRLADDFDRSLLAKKMFNILKSVSSAHKKN
ncbi:MAG: glycosyltransferase, partial [bacterium]